MGVTEGPGTREHHLNGGIFSAGNAPFYKCIGAYLDNDGCDLHPVSTFCSNPTRVSLVWYRQA